MFFSVAFFMPFSFIVSLCLFYLFILYFISTCIHLESILSLLLYFRGHLGILLNHISTVANVLYLFPVILCLVTELCGV